MGGWGNARALRVPEPLGPSGLPPAGGCLRSRLLSITLLECCCLLAPVHLSSLILGGLPFRVAASCASTSPAGAAWGILFCVPCPGDRSGRAPQQLPAKCGAGSHFPQGSAGRYWLRNPGHGSKVWSALQRGLHPGLGTPRGAGCGLLGTLLEDTLPRVLCLYSRGRKGFPVDMHSLSKSKPPSFITNVKEKNTFS